MNLKYIKRSENNLAETTINQLIEEAKLQLIQYKNDELILRSKGKTELKKIVLVYHGWELIEMKEIFD